MPSAAVDVQRGERADIVDGRDAAGCRDLMLGGGAQPAEPIEIRPLHHAFFIDIGAQESAAVGLEPADHFFGGEIRRLLPALDDDLAVLRIQRDNYAFGSDRCRDLFEALA